MTAAEPLKIGVTGAGGRMGRTLIEAVYAADGLVLGSAIEKPGSSLVGVDAGELAGLGPLGIKVGRGESYANILVALGLAFVWYFATVIVEWLEKSPALRPDLLIWLPNIAFQVLGIILFKRISGR